jgi:exosortase
VNSSPSKSLDSEPIRGFEASLPFTEKYRNVLFLVLLAGAIAWFWQPLGALYALTTQKDYYSHIILIPWMSLYVFYADRNTILSIKGWRPGLGLAVVGIGVWFSTYGPDVLSAHILAFAIVCGGMFVTCYGMRACRTFMFGLLFLLFMVPLPENVIHVIIAYLQWGSAEMTDVLFTGLGVPFARDGFLFGLPNLTIHVAEECSGIRSTLSLVITSLLAGHFVLRSLWARAALVFLVVPLAIVKNAFRIVGLSLLANYVDASFITDSALHRYGGIPLFVLSLAMLLCLAWLLRNMEKRTVGSLPDRLAC